MKKNSQIHLWLETNFKEMLERQAQESNISVNELCRQKLIGNTITIKLDEIASKLNSILEDRGIFKAKRLKDSKVNSRQVHSPLNLP